MRVNGGDLLSPSSVSSDFPEIFAQSLSVEPEQVIVAESAPGKSQQVVVAEVAGQPLKVILVFDLVDGLGISGEPFESVVVGFPEFVYVVATVNVLLGEPQEVVVQTV